MRKNKLEKVPVQVEVIDVRTSDEERKHAMKAIKGHNRLKGSRFIPNTPNIEQYRESRKKQIEKVA